MMIFMAEQAKGTGNLDKELEALYQPKAVQQKKTAAKAASTKAKAPGKSSTKKKAVIARGKRKRAVARATLLPGNGTLLFNGSDIKMMKPDVLRELVMEPIRISAQAQGLASSSNISINVYGGGRSGQAQAARSALAKVLASASGEGLKSMYMQYDRTLMVDDYRRVEPKKFLGPKARAKFQKSYR